MTTEAEQFSAWYAQERAQRVAAIQDEDAARLKARRLKSLPRIYVAIGSTSNFTGYLLPQQYFGDASKLLRFLTHTTLRDIKTKDEKLVVMTCLPHYVAGYQELHRQGIFDVTLVRPDGQECELDLDGDLIDPWPDEFLSLEFNMRFQHGSCAESPDGNELATHKTEPEKDAGVLPATAADIPGNYETVCDLLRPWSVTVRAESSDPAWFMPRLVCEQPPACAELTYAQKLHAQYTAGCYLRRSAGGLHWVAYWEDGTPLKGDVAGYEDVWYFDSKDAAEQALVAGYEPPEKEAQCS